VFTVGQLLTLSVWPLVGLIAYWARDRDAQPPWPWLPVHLLLGPFMIVPIAWRFVSAPAARRPSSAKQSRKSRRDRR
jgi:hypothetical protein